MAMEDILKALMQSAAAQPSSQSQPSGGSGDAMAQMLGGMLGGQGQGAAGGGDLVAQAIGGLLGGQQSSGGAGTGALLGGLQQILGGTPGTGQQLPLGGGSASLGANDPIMMLLQPVVNNLAAKAGISPQIATILASIALHYLLQSSPNTPGASPLNLGSVMQTLAAGKGVSPTALQQSGMINDVMQATGMNEQQATRSLSTTFDVLGGHLTPAKQVQTSGGLKTGRGVKSSASVKRKKK
jgi:hypothetical protein